MDESINICPVSNICSKDDIHVSRLAHTRLMENNVRGDAFSIIAHLQNKAIGEGVVSECLKDSSVDTDSGFLFYYCTATICRQLIVGFLCVCRILDVEPNRLSVGGIRSMESVLHRRGQIATHDFVGCIMELAVNGRPLEPSQALASHGILDRSATPPPTYHLNSLQSEFHPLAILSRLLPSVCLLSRCGTSARLLHTFSKAERYQKPVADIYLFQIF